jgi:hypothetical protein
VVMIQVSIADLKPGMILAESVRNSQGLLLLDGGTKITKKHIRIFKSWGVMEIFVEGHLKKPKNAEAVDVTDVEEPFEMEMKSKFSDVLDDPVMVEIFKAARKQLKKNLSSNEHEK